MLTNKFGCNIIINDSKRVSRSLKTEHERISEQQNAISERNKRTNEIETDKQIKKQKHKFLESLILAQDERWRHA